VDSDVVRITLYVDGQARDTFSDWANFDGLPKQRIGDAERWRPVLAASQSPDQLREVWKDSEADYPFQSEGILQRVAKLLGLGIPRVWVDQDDHELNNVSLSSYLHFKFAELSPYTRRAEGAPSLYIFGYNITKVLKTEQRKLLLFRLRNEGGESKGL